MEGQRQLERRICFRLILQNMEFLKDLWKFLLQRKKFWLLPIILVLLLLGVLIVIGGGSAVAPFIYTLF